MKKFPVRAFAALVGGVSLSCTAPSPRADEVEFGGDELGARPTVDATMTPFPTKESRVFAVRVSAARTLYFFPSERFRPSIVLREFDASLGGWQGVTDLGRPTTQFLSLSAVAMMPDGTIAVTGGAGTDLAIFDGTTKPSLNGFVGPVLANGVPIPNARQALTGVAGGFRFFAIDKDRKVYASVQANRTTSWSRRTLGGVPILTSKVTWLWSMGTQQLTACPRAFGDLAMAPTTYGNPALYYRSESATVVECKFDGAAWVGRDLGIAPAGRLHVTEFATGERSLHVLDAGTRAIVVNRWNGATWTGWGSNGTACVTELHSVTPWRDPATGGLEASLVLADGDRRVWIARESTSPRAGAPDGPTCCGNAAERCCADAVCGKGLGCTTTNVCAVAGRRGEPCLPGSACLDGLVCTAGVCGGGGLGEPCLGSGAARACTDPANRCIDGGCWTSPGQAVGAPCGGVGGVQCVGALACEGGTCVSTCRGGASCIVPGVSGACRAGVLACDARTGVASCVGQVAPQPESCDGVDNDCNGVVDDIAAVTCTNVDRVARANCGSFVPPAGRAKCEGRTQVCEAVADRDFCITAGARLANGGGCGVGREQLCSVTSLCAPGNICVTQYVGGVMGTRQQVCKDSGAGMPVCWMPSDVGRDGAATITTPGGGGAVGATCTSSSDCANADCRKHPERAGFTCSQSCSSSAPCPSGLRCVRGACFP